MAYEISKKLNIRPQYNSPVVVHVSSGDIGIPITFEMYDGNEPFEIPSGSVISVQGTRKDGASWITTGTASGSEVTFTSPSAMAAVEGAGIGEVSITSGTETVGTANFLVLVERATIPNGVTYSSDPSVFQDILKYVKSGIAVGMAEATAGAVAEWLEENITPTTPAVDASLSITGAAADAAVTGSAKNELRSLESISLNTCQVTWEQGGIGSANGNTSSNSNRIRTRKMMLGSCDLAVAKSGYEIAAFSYNNDTNLTYRGCWNGSEEVVGTLTWLKSINFKDFPSNIRVAIVMRKQGDANITTDASSNCILYTNLNNDLINNEAVTFFTGYLSSGKIYTSGDAAYLTSKRRLLGFVPRSMGYCKAKPDYKIALYLYDGFDVLGYWTGSELITDSIPWRGEFDLNEVFSTYENASAMLMVESTDSQLTVLPTEYCADFIRIPQDGFEKLVNASELENVGITISDGLASASEKRITFKSKTNGTSKVFVNPNGMYWWVCVSDFGNDNNPAHVYTPTWRNDVGVVQVEHSGELYVSFATGKDYASSRSILPSDYSAVTVLFDGDADISEYIVDASSSLLTADNGSILTAKENLISNVVSGQALNSSGTVVSDANSKTSDFIELPKWNSNPRYNPYTRLYAMSYNNSTFDEHYSSVCFYDAAKSFISQTTSGDIEIPANAFYARATFPSSNIMLYVGCGILDELPTYMPYHRTVSAEYIPCFANNIHNSDGAKTNLVKTALQYCGNTDFGYGNTHTAFSESAEAVESDGIMSASGVLSDDVCYEGVKYQIDCSGFTRLTMQCIYPKYSRHYMDKNIVPPWGFRYDEDADFDTPQGRLTAHKQALYAYKRGMLFPVKSDYSNIEVGDMIFVANSSAMWGAIGHARIVTNVVPLKDGGNMVTIMEANSSFPPVHASKSTTRAVDNYYGARFPLPYADNVSVIGSAQAATVQTSSQDLTIATIALDEATKDKEIYTIAFTAKFTNANNYAYVEGLGDDITFANILDYDGLHYISVVLPVDGSSGSSEVTITSKYADTVTFGGAKVYKGFHTPTMSEFND